MSYAVWLLATGTSIGATLAMLLIAPKRAWIPALIAMPFIIRGFWP